MRGLTPIVIVFLFASVASAQKVELPKTGKPFKRGKAIQISWKTENTNPVHIELYKGTKWIAGELDQPNSGSYSLMIPPYTDAGKDYRIRITDARDPNRVIVSDNFRVIPKIPALVKVIPVGLAVAFFLVVEGGSKSAGAAQLSGQGTTHSYVHGN
jgi:hypothetical protein